MEGELIDLLREGGPLAVVSVVAIYLLLKDRKNNRRSSNPGPPLIDGRWQEEMREGQRETNAKLGRIERALILLLGRMGVDPPP